MALTSNGFYYAVTDDDADIGAITQSMAQSAESKYVTDTDTTSFVALSRNAANPYPLVSDGADHGVAGYDTVLVHYGPDLAYTGGGIITVNVTRWYQFHMTVIWDSVPANTVQHHQDQYLWRNQQAVAAGKMMIVHYPASTASTAPAVSSSGNVKLFAGDQIQLAMFQNSGAGLSNVISVFSLKTLLPRAVG